MYLSTYIDTYGVCLHLIFSVIFLYYYTLYIIFHTVLFTQITKKRPGCYQPKTNPPLFPNEIFQTI